MMHFFQIHVYKFSKNYQSETTSERLFSNNKINLKRVTHNNTAHNNSYKTLIHIKLMDKNSLPVYINTILNGKDHD